MPSIRFLESLGVAASIAASASLNIAPGVAPTTPVDGDLWTTGTSIYARIGGVTYDLAATTGFTTQFSITGTTLINLVNDVASPAARSYYGTDDTATRGWNVLSTTQDYSVDTGERPIVGNSLTTTASDLSSVQYTSTVTPGFNPGIFYAHVPSSYDYMDVRGYNDLFYASGAPITRISITRAVLTGSFDPFSVGTGALISPFCQQAGASPTFKDFVADDPNAPDPYTYWQVDIFSGSTAFFSSSVSMIVEIYGDSGYTIPITTLVGTSVNYSNTNIDASYFVKITVDTGGGVPPVDWTAMDTFLGGPGTFYSVSSGGSPLVRSWQFDAFADGFSFNMNGDQWLAFEFAEGGVTPFASALTLHKPSKWIPTGGLTTVAGYGCLWFDTTSNKFTYNQNGGPNLEFGTATSLAIPYIQIREEQPSGTDGGTFTSGSWQTRVLNTEVADTAGIATLSSNQITLPAGTYEAYATAPTFSTFSMLRIQDVTNGVTLARGSTTSNAAGDGNLDLSQCSGRFTLVGTTAIEVQHRCVSTTATVGLGAAASFGVNEIYAEIILRKVA